MKVTCIDETAVLPGVSFRVRFRSLNSSSLMKIKSIFDGFQILQQSQLRLFVVFAFWVLLSVNQIDSSLSVVLQQFVIPSVPRDR